MNAHTYAASAVHLSAAATGTAHAPWTTEAHVESMLLFISRNLILGAIITPLITGN